MAITKCKECGAQVSDQAATCPHCGVANPGTTSPPQSTPFTVTHSPANPAKRKLSKAEIVGGLAVGIAVIYFLARTNAPEPVAPAASVPAAPTAPVACKADDLKCRGDKGIFDAATYCIEPIERLSKYSMRWIDGMLETKFDRFAWKDKAGGNITYIGDRVEFQNGFGAYARMTYVCTLADDNKTVLDVRVVQGLLK
jgi:hypothetical protein